MPPKTPIVGCRTSLEIHILSSNPILQKNVARMLLALCVVFVASVAYAQDAQPLELGKTYTVTVPARQFKYFQYTAQNGDTLKYSVLRTSPATGGQDLTYIRKDQPPTKLDYDEIDTDAGASHVIQFTPVPGLYYFAVLNVARKPSVYNVTLTSLASKVPVLSWEGDAFPVCEGINPPMYGPPSLSVGLSSFSVTCLRKHIHSRGVVEFRKFNGALIRADSLRLPRGGLFSEPAVKFVKNTYQVSSSFAIDTRFIHLELRSYEQDGTIIQNVTTWGDTFLAETREMYPQILWNGTALKFYWHKQYEWYALYTRAFDLRGNPVNRQDYVREPVRDKDNPRLHPARVRAVLNEVEELETQEVAFFVWEGQDPSIGPRQLSFWVQVPETERQARKYIINGDSWINDTDGGIDMVATDDDDYVLVHPVAGYSTIQVTKMYGFS